MNISSFSGDTLFSVCSYLREKDRGALSSTCRHFRPFATKEFERKVCREQASSLLKVNSIYIGLCSLLQRFFKGKTKLFTEQEVCLVERVFSHVQPQSEELHESLAYFDFRGEDAALKRLLTFTSFYQWIIQKMYHYYCPPEIGKMLSSIAKSTSISKEEFALYMSDLDSFFNDDAPKELEEFYFCLAAGEDENAREFMQTYQGPYPSFRNQRYFFSIALEALAYKGEVDLLEREIQNNRQAYSSYDISRAYLILGECLCSAGRVEEATLLESRIDDTTSKTSFYKAICKGLFLSRHFDQIPQFYNKILDVNRLSVNIYLKYCNLWKDLLEGMCKKGHVEISYEFFKGIQQRGRVNTLNCNLSLSVLFKYFCKDGNFAKASEVFHLMSQISDKERKRMVKCLAQKGYYGESAYQVRQMERGPERNRAIDALAKSYGPAKPWFLSSANFTLYDFFRFNLILERLHRNNQRFSVYYLLKLVGIELLFFQRMLWLHIVLGRTYFSLLKRASQLGWCSL